MWEYMNDRNKSVHIIGLAFDLGFQIAIPLVVFALIGRFADKAFDTTPFLLVGGIVLAALASTYMVYRKVSKLLKD